MHRHTYIETCTYISFSALLTPPQDARSRSRPDRKAGSVQTDFSVVSGDTLG